MHFFQFEAKCFFKTKLCTYFFKNAAQLLNLNHHSIIACFSEILSTWTFKRPPTYLPWKIVDI